MCSWWLIIYQNTLWWCTKTFQKRKCLHMETVFWWITHTWKMCDRVSFRKKLIWNVNKLPRVLTYLPSDFTISDWCICLMLHCSQGPLLAAAWQAPPCGQGSGFRSLAPPASPYAPHPPSHWPPSQAALERLLVWQTPPPRPDSSHHPRHRFLKVRHGGKEETKQTFCAAVTPPQIQF